ncbi:MAG: molybdenum cofactor biosynthesis protein B [Pseudohongiella nitratireducens]|nr:molybdenum cofactor biosynthesis protein B [Pseudohongiella nitratireducens]MDF1623630.1 molybdenum cofactor biosynthesis protein B [Pseudohongiella nitratireducens]
MQSSLSIAVITVSDTRTEETDTSGKYLQEQVTLAGHKLVSRQIVKDDTYLLRAIVATLVADESVNAVLLTGGTGFTKRDNTVKAIQPLFDTPIEGFGELFRMLSHAERGSSSMQSRAIAGLSNNTIIFCMPGSTGACRTAWEGLIAEQLNAAHKPCNFVEKLVS